MLSLYRLWQLYEASPAWCRRVTGAAVAAVPVRFRYGGAFRSTWELMETAESWSAEEHRSYQLRELRRVLSLAGSRVPYYRRLFERCSFDPARVRDIADLAVLPLLTRDMVRDLGADLLPDGRPPARSKYSTTSGTSGKPLGFWIGHDASAREWAFMLRGWRTAGFHPGDRRVVIRGRTIAGRQDGRLWEHDAINRALYISSFDLNTGNLRACVEAIERYRPLFLHAYPSSALLLAHYLREHDLRLRTLRGVLLGSENIHGGIRQYLGEIFGCRIFTWYGHSEKAIFAPECACGQVYRSVPQYGVTELVDAGGRAIRERGRRGVLVGTGFINDGTIFIRYLTDDEAEWTGETCPGCGAHGTLIRNVVGRWNQEYLVGRSGALISIAAVNLHTAIYTKLRQFQFYQQTPGHATLRFVPVASFCGADERQLGDELSKKLAGELDVTLQQVNDLALSTSGKFKFVDQRIPLDASGVAQSPAANGGEQPPATSGRSELM